MCGICGFVGPPSPPVLKRMTDALVHRGPDAAGAFTDGEVSLGHRRLSIIDLAQGQQPVFNEDRTIAIVFNGEIYNHCDLRPQLEALGHRYASQCDTETIVHAYEAWGVDCVTRLDGMFAFVLYDARRQLLFGARDRLGKKPLYFTTRPCGPASGEVALAFASELKSLRAHPAVAASLQVAPGGLVSYLLNDYVLGPQSIYEGVERLEAGSAFVFGLPGSSAPGLRRWRYWNLHINAENQPGASPPLSEEAAADRLIDLLRRAVHKRLMSDVPLGVLLSGGVDSSAIVALLAQLRPPGEIDTFSIGFDEPSFDESGYAEQVARHFGTRHLSRRFTAADLQSRLPGIAAQMDEPFADPSLLPVAMLAEFARQHVTVALGGDGGDEIFAGYDPFRAVAPARVYRRLVSPALHARVLVPLARWLPVSEANMPLGFRVTRFLRGALVEPRLRPAAWMGAFSLDQLQRLVPDLGDCLAPEQAYAPILAAARAAPPANADGLAYSLDFFQRFYLPDDILVKADRASMLHSLEIRSPFLDTELVEFVNALPLSLKLRRGTTKYLLKQALGARRSGAPLLPPEIVHRRKKGFGIPVARWIRHELQPLFRETLIGDWPEQALPMFNRWEIERLFDDHVRRAANNYKELWALFMLAQWARTQAP